jgi:preprotein translocase subunit YajC
MMQTLLLQAQAGPPPPPGAPPGGGPQNPMGGCAGGQGGMFIPMIMIFVVFYFMLIRPQQKKQRELQDWLKGLKKGDEVVTTGGIIGKISGITDTVVTLEVQEKVRMKFLRSHIAGRAPGTAGPGPEAPAAPADKK